VLVADDNNCVYGGVIPGLSFLIFFLLLLLPTTVGPISSPVSVNKPPRVRQAQKNYE